MDKWTEIKRLNPPYGEFVKTKIIKSNGESTNEQIMKFERNLWWTEDGNYVYYTPTHWKRMASCNFSSKYN